MMQVQKQTQQISEEEFLIPLSEDEQDSVQGGPLPLVVALGIAVTRMAAVQYSRRAAAGAVTAHRRVNDYGKNNPVTTGVVIGGAGVAGSYYVSREG